MITKERFTFLGIIFLMLGFLLTSSPQSTFAESRYLAQKYGFGIAGDLISPITVDFGNGIKKNVYMNKKPIDKAKNKALLLVAFPLDSENSFTLQMYNSETYSIYKVRLRDSRKEEIVILGLSESDGRKVKVTELYIIGQDDFGNILPMQVKGFYPLEVLNTPLQLDAKRNIVLPLSGSGKLLRIYWDPTATSFVFGYIEAPAQRKPAKTLENSYNETVEDVI